MRPAKCALCGQRIVWQATSEGSGKGSRQLCAAPTEASGALREEVVGATLDGQCMLHHPVHGNVLSNA